jgi:hypothetical protein
MGKVSSFKNKKKFNKIHTDDFFENNVLCNNQFLNRFFSNFHIYDALPSPGVNPLEGSPKCSCGKLGLGRRSRLPTLERGRGSSWEPRH